MHQEKKLPWKWKCLSASVDGLGDASQSSGHPLGRQRVGTKCRKGLLVGAREPSEPVVNGRTGHLRQRLADVNAVKKYMDGGEEKEEGLIPVRKRPIYTQD